MDLNDKIYIAGHRGLVGSAIVRQLEGRGFTNLLMRTHKELDLTNQVQVQTFLCVRIKRLVNPLDSNCLTMAEPTKPR